MMHLLSDLLGELVAGLVGAALISLVGASLKFLFDYLEDEKNKTVKNNPKTISTKK